MKATKRSYLRKLNSLTQLSNAARRWVPDLDTFFVDPADRLPFDPTVSHAVTLATNEPAAEQPLGRATCICGADTGWLPLWDVELRAHWHRREAEKAMSQGSGRAGDSAPRFDRTLFATLAQHKSSSQGVRTPPVVPLPILDDQQPILLVYDERDLAIDLAYERHPLPGGTRVRSVSERSMDYWVPRLTPVFAVSDGMIVYARKHLDGHTIIIDHGNDWLTVYHRLEHMFVDINDCAAELVQDALERTFDGRRPWDPDARPLLDHLRGVIRSRSSQHYEHAKRFRVAKLNPRDHLSPTEDNDDLEDRADETFAAIVRLAIHDPQVSLLLDAYSDGLLLRADVLARTGLTDQQYEAARDRLARMRDTLPNRLAGIGAKHFSRSGRRTHAGRGARPHE